MGLGGGVGCFLVGHGRPFGSAVGLYGDQWRGVGSEDVF